MLVTLDVETGYFQSPNAWLHASFHPAKGDSQGAFVFVPPFGEERKCAYRLMVEMATTLAAAGFDVLRFDLSGTGESLGDHAQQSISAWAADIAAAHEQLNELSKSEHVWLLGARLGANLALAADIEELAGLVLWEPLMSGDAYLREMFRRKQIKEMMGAGEASSLEEQLQSQWEAGKSVDFDGFEVGPELKKELEELELKRTLETVEQTKALLCHVGGARKLTGPWAELESVLTADTQKVLCIRQKPFWGLLDYEESKELKDETLAFCLD